MKQTLHIYGCVLGLLLATSLRAQDAGRSRLNLGRNAPTTSAMAPVAGKPQRLLMAKPLVMAPMDRLITMGKNSAMQAYYRSLLIAPNAPAARPLPGARAAADTPTPLTTERTVSEPAHRAEDLLYASDRVTVSNIYPNPAHDAADLDYQLSTSVGSVGITLLNILGSPIAEYTLDWNDRKVRIQTRDLPNGYYFYQLTVEGTKVATKKLLVKHQ